VAADAGFAATAGWIDPDAFEKFIARHEHNMTGDGAVGKRMECGFSAAWVTKSDPN
jgi:hypothetical protein